MKKVIKKLKERKGADNTIEASANIFVYVIIFLLVLMAINIMYKEYQLHIFSSELIRTAELYGEVGEETTRRQKELEKSLGIQPTVKWSRVGKYNLNEEINLTLSLKVSAKIPFYKGGITLIKNATGTSEVYRK